MAKEVVRNINININGKEVVNSFSGISKAMRETHRDIANLNKNDADYQQQLKKHQDRLAELRQHYGNFKDEIKGTSAVIKKASNEANAGSFSFQNFMSALTSGDVQGLHDEFQLLSNGIGNVTKQTLAFIATPIGAAITALTGIVIATKYWYDYNTEMEKATQLVQQFTGLTGVALEQATVSTKAFADIAEEDLKQVTNAVNSVAKAYNVDYLQALELVENGYVRGGKAADDFFDNTAEYVVQFKNAGYTAKEFFSILEQGAKEGIYKDKLVDTIKEMDLRLKEMTKSATDALTAAFGSSFTDKLANGVKSGAINTKLALQMISTEADKVGLNFQQKQQLVADVFGAMGEDAGGFERVVEAINNGLKDTNRELTDVEAAQLRVIKASENLEQAMSNLFNVTGGGFETMIANAKEFALNWLTKIVRGVNNLLILSGAFNKSVATVFVTIKETAKAMLGFSEVGAKAWDLDFGGAVDAFKKHFNNVGNTINAGKDTVKKILNDAGTEIQAGYAEKWNAWGSSDFLSGSNGTSSNPGSSNNGNDKAAKKAAEKAERERKRLEEAEKKKQEELKKIWERGEKEIDEILQRSKEQRELAQLQGFEREKAQITNKYAAEIEKYKDHTDRIKELEAARDAEIEDARQQRATESLQRANDIEDQNRIIRAEQEAEIEAEKIFNFEERALFMLEKQREIALMELDIEREKELEKLHIAGATAEEIAALEASFALAKINMLRENAKAEKELRSQQVDWTKLTEDQKLNTVKSALNGAAEAANEGSGAWKAAKIGETTIATYQSATNAFNALAGIPIVGPALGTAAAALAVVSGMKNIQKISSTPLQKMPTHYYGGPTGNKGIGMSDEFGVITGGVHANEWVSPAFMTQSPRYAPIINWLENERQMQLNGVAGSMSNPFFDNPVFTLLASAVVQLNENIEKGIVAKNYIGYEDLEKMNTLNTELQQSKQNAIISK